jgi:outer membrane protein OmpA-like peptidoglycan-associated protein
MNPTHIHVSCGLLVAALSASLVYRSVVAADPAAPAVQDPVPAAAADDLGAVGPDFDALISEIEARQPVTDPVADDAADDGTPEEVRAARIQIGILRQAVVAALAARAEAEAQLETLWRDSRREIEDLKAAQAEGATRISALESALAEAKGAGVAGAGEGAVQPAAFAPADDALAKSVADGDKAADLASVAPASGPTEIMLNEIHFNPGSADLTPGAERKTLEAAEKIKLLGATKVRVSGYTDTLGPAAFNKHLSLQRARSIATLLSSVGVAADIIDLEGNGEDGAP